MVTNIIENIEEYAILDTVKENYDSDYAFSVRLSKGVQIGRKFVALEKWKIINQFNGVVAIYNPESKILTMLV